jgi:hypothetical protein
MLKTHLVETCKRTLRGAVVSVEMVETAIACHAHSVGEAIKHDFCHVMALCLKLLKSLIVLLDHG